MPFCEFKRNLHMAQRMVGGQDIKQKFEASVAEAACNAQKCTAADKKKPGQWVAGLTTGDFANKGVAHCRKSLALCAQSGWLHRLMDAACRADQASLCSMKRCNQIRNVNRVMLTIAAHDAQQVGFGAEHAQYARFGKTGIFKSEDQAYSRIVKATPTDFIGRAVWGVVV